MFNGSRATRHVLRRRLVGGLGATLAAWTAGCVSPTDTHDGTTPTEETDTTTTDTTNDTDTTTTTTDTTTTDTTNDTDTTTAMQRSRPIQIVVRSSDAATRTVTLELSTDTETIDTTTVDLDPDTRATLDTPISEPGRYELTVSADPGPTTTRPFAIDDYDLRAGSNLIVEVDESEVTVLLQE